MRVNPCSALIFLNVFIIDLLSFWFVKFYLFPQVQLFSRFGPFCPPLDPIGTYYYDHLLKSFDIWVAQGLLLNSSKFWATFISEFYHFFSIILKEKMCNVKGLQYNWP